MTTPPDPVTLLRSGVPGPAGAGRASWRSRLGGGLLLPRAGLSKLQGWIFTSLPKELGFHAEPLWWPILPLALAGVLVSLTLRYLPGTGGHSPADGFKAGEGPPPLIELPRHRARGLCHLEPGRGARAQEGPLIALGAGLGALAVRLVDRDAPARVQSVMAAAGSFAAISTLLGSPLTGAFLLMEASGLGGPMMQLVLVPWPAGRGRRIADLHRPGRLDRSWHVLAGDSRPPHVGAPTGGEFLWALAIGLLAVPVGSGIRWLGLFLRPHVERRILLLTPVVGLAVAGLAIAFAAGTGKASSEVLFSGQSALGPLITNSASYTVGALLLLIACKGLAYGVSLSSFRGGPTFPALLIGAAGGIALSHLRGCRLSTASPWASARSPS